MGNIKIVYLAGPFRGNFFKKTYNIALARTWARKLWLNGICVVCPHLNSGFIDHPLTDKFILPANIELMKRCDAVFVIGNWKKSKGTVNELVEALYMKMPVFFSLPLLLSKINSLDEYAEEQTKFIEKELGHDTL